MGHGVTVSRAWPPTILSWLESCSSTSLPKDAHTCSVLSVIDTAEAECIAHYNIQWNLSKTTARGTFKTWSLLPGGLLIQGDLTGNSIPWSWFQWSSRTGGRLIRVVSLTGFTVQAHVVYGYSFIS